MLLKVVFSRYAYVHFLTHKPKAPDSFTRRVLADARSDGISSMFDIVTLTTEEDSAVGSLRRCANSMALSRDSRAL